MQDQKLAILDLIRIQCPMKDIRTQHYYDSAFLITSREHLVSPDDV